jgi:hypothetical protein
MPGQGSPNQTQRNVPHPTTTGQAPRGDEDRDRSQSKDQPDRDRNHVQGRGQPDQDLGRTQGQSDRSQGQNDQDRIQGQNGRDRDRERTQGEAERPSTGSGGAVNLTTEQRTKIRQTVLAGNNAPRADKVTFSVNVGTVVPRTVRVVEVPETLVEIHPEWRGFRYFVYNDEIIIVEPDTLKIVAIVTV